MFTETQIENITKKWGQDVYTKILFEIEVYSKKWKLFNGLHIKPENPGLYKKYVDGINDCVDSMSKREECKDLYRYTLKAKDVCMSVSAIYPDEMLLHGDLSFHNILLRDNGKYAIVDPQGRL